MSGWIKLHRSLLDWEWYSDHNTLLVFVHLLLKANYVDSKYRGHDVPAGSLVTGRITLAESLRISERCVRTALDHLKNSGEVTIKPHPKFSIITITKWKDYQQDDQQVTSNRPASDQQVTTSKEGKKERKKESMAKPDSASESVWYDFLEHRKKKKAPVTQTVVDGIQKEASKANITLDAALAECCIRNWQSFKAEWYNKPSQFEKPKPQRAGVKTL